MNAAGLRLVKEFEGCSLTAYYDGGTDEQGVPHGKLTIGWGHTRGVFAGDCCSQEAADAWLLEDLAVTEGAVLALTHRIPLNDDQISALISFCFNVGFGAKGRKDGFMELISGEPSTMLKCLKANDFKGAAEEFPKWINVGGQKSAGLMRRRLAEQALFRREQNLWIRSIKALNPLKLLRLKSKL